MKPLLKMNKEKTLPYSRQLISSDDIKNVTKVLNSDYLTQGKNVSEFENKISKIVNSKYAVAANSATSSLHLACLALGMKKGDWLWTSPNSFIASANCGIYCGAKVDFIDIDLNTYNISFSKLEQKLKKSRTKTQNRHRVCFQYFVCVLGIHRILILLSFVPLKR